MRTLVIAAMTLTACGAERFVPYTPATAHTDKKPDAIFSSAIRVLASDGITIASKDRESRIITSEWEEKENIGKYRFRWVVSVDGGTVSVVSQCQWWDTTSITQSAKWVKCQGGSQPKSRGAEGKALADKIAIGAK